jgi:hypothetical protein
MNRRSRIVSMLPAAFVAIVLSCGCGSGGGGAGATPTPSPAAQATPTATESQAQTPTPTATATPAAVVPVAEAVVRDASGVALRIGQTLTTEGVITVAAGIFANNKLKVFVQEGGGGIMVYHQSAGDVEAFQEGQLVRATGVIRQQDPTSDNNPARGTVLVDVTQGEAIVLGSDNPLPEAQPVTLSELNTGGTAYTGTLVRVSGVRKTSGEWPAAGSRSSHVDISDDGGASTAILRLQRNAITTALVQELEAIGDGEFTARGIVVQDDTTDEGKLWSGFEIWVRGEGDIGAGQQTSGG